jgi:hypothetical protein
MPTDVVTGTYYKLQRGMIGVLKKMTVIFCDEFLFYGAFICSNFRTKVIYSIVTL